MTPERSQSIKYVVADWLSTSVAMLLFNMLRYYVVSTYLPIEVHSVSRYMTSFMLVVEQVFFPFLMISLFWITGFYNDTLYRSRLQVVGNTAFCAVSGTLIFFFTAMLNDALPARHLTYELLLAMASIIFVITGSLRWMLAFFSARALHQHRRQISTLVIGAGQEARKFARRLDSLRKPMGFDIKGFVDLKDAPVASGRRPVYKLDEIEKVCADYCIKTLIIVPESRSSLDAPGLLGRLMALDMPLLLRPRLISAGALFPRFNNVCGEPLVDISRPRINPATVNLKRVSDVVLSTIALVTLAPVMAILAVAVKLDSHGPVFYRQRRVGYHRRPFTILKFRTMVVDAEADGPALSSANDPRVTSVGRILRKYRLDELPNFINVWRGEMSIVGPRPEREFFVEQLIERVPSYSLLHSVKPGITSWGMVKYGYARNIDEMVERMKYDLLYVENMSISVDLKILFYTVHTVITGKGV